MTESGGHVRYVIDHKAAGTRDHLGLVLVQARTETNLTADQAANLQIVGGDGSTPTDSCLFTFFQAPAEGDFFLGRAQGNSTIARSGVKGGGGFFSGASGGGGGGGENTETIAALKPKQWALLGAGSSGLDDTILHDAKGGWTTTLDFDARPERVIILPSASYLCGVGFSRFPGSLPQGMGDTGGHLGLNTSLYGSSLRFGAVGLAGPTSSGTATFLGSSEPLTAATNVDKSSDAVGHLDIAIQQWQGNVAWLMAGLRMPFGSPGA